MMEKAELDKNLKSSVRTHVLMSFAIIFLLLGGIVAWATMTEIAGAVVASGTVVVESNIKQVQHQEGGTVQSIHVRNGDVIGVGDLLIGLDDTVTRANLAVVTKQLDSLYAQEARLIAEQDGLAVIKFSDEQADDAVRATSIEIIKDSQQRLFEARRNSLNGQKQQLGEQIVQFEKQIEGYQAQKKSKVTETEFVTKELEDLDGLLSQQLVSASRVSVLNREKAQLEGELGGFTAQIAQTKEAISERNMQILQLDEDFLASVLQQLQDTRVQIAQLEEQSIAAQDQLTRIEIRAPRSGLVHNLNVHTIGQVIASGEVTMLIVPQDDELIIEAQVQPINIDQIAAHQQATIRLPSFDQRTTPELKANVKTISADLLQDEVTGLSFYQVRLVIPEEELSKLGDKILVPGMPVEAFIKTEDRTVISYLTKPITDQIKHAMRER
jgi:HlyD family secretion protein